MTESVADKTPIPSTTSLRHTDPPGLWMAVVTGSVILHLLLLWLMISSSLSFLNRKASPISTPIQVVDVVPRRKARIKPVRVARQRPRVSPKIQPQKQQKPQVVAPNIAKPTIPETLQQRDTIAFTNPTNNKKPTISSPRPKPAQKPKSTQPKRTNTPNTQPPIRKQPLPTQPVRPPIRNQPPTRNQPPQTRPTQPPTRNQPPQTRPTQAPPKNPPPQPTEDNQDFDDIFGRDTNNGDNSNPKPNSPTNPVNNSDTPNSPGEKISQQPTAPVEPKKAPRPSGDTPQPVEQVISANWQPLGRDALVDLFKAKIIRGQPPEVPPRYEGTNTSIQIPAELLTASGIKNQKIELQALLFIDEGGRLITRIREGTAEKPIRPRIITTAPRQQSQDITRYEEFLIKLFEKEQFTPAQQNGNAIAGELLVRMTIQPSQVKNTGERLPGRMLDP